MIAATARRGRKKGSWIVISAAEIKKRRKELGLSRAKLAEAIEVSPASIQNWEAGKAPSLPMQDKLRAYFDKHGGKTVTTKKSKARKAKAAKPTQPDLFQMDPNVAGLLTTMVSVRPDKSLTEIASEIKEALSILNNDQVNHTQDTLAETA